MLRQYPLTARILRKVLLCAFLIAQLSSSEKSWNNVRKVPISNLDACEELCSKDTECFRSSLYPNARMSTVDSPYPHLCFLESELMLDIEKNISALSDSRKTVSRISKKKKDKINRDYIGIQQLVSGPIAIDSTFLMNYPQHFVRGCSYTISMWVWIWKSKKLSKRSECALFSTRYISPSLVSDEYGILLPSIIFNLASRIGKLFFSAAKDKNGDYSGFSPSYNIRYYEWTHISMTIDGNFINAYINGKHYQKTRMNPPTKSSNTICPYTFLENGNSEGVENVAANNSNSKNISNALSSNTMLQIAGARLRPSTPMMMQDFFVLRGIALTQPDIMELMNSRIPNIPPTLKKVLRLNNIYSLENYSVKEWEDNYYLMMEWGVCPVGVCGPVCFEESFLLGYSFSDLYHDRNDDTSGNEGYHDEDHFEDLLDDYYGDEGDDIQDADLFNSQYSGPLFDTENDGVNFDPINYDENQMRSQFDDVFDDVFDDSFGNDFENFDEFVQGPLTKEESEILSEYYDDLDDYYGDNGEINYSEADYQDYEKSFSDLNEEFSQPKKKKNKNKNKSEDSEKMPEISDLKKSLKKLKFSKKNHEDSNEIKMKNRTDEFNKRKIKESSLKESSLISLPRRHSFRKQKSIIKSMKNKRKVLKKIKPVLPFSYKDFFENIDMTQNFENIWNYFQNDFLHQKIPENKEKNSKIKNLSKEKLKKGKESGKIDDDTYNESNDYQYKVDLLNELDAEHEAYLQHHPIGELNVISSYYLYEL